MFKVRVNKIAAHEIEFDADKMVLSNGQTKQTGKMDGKSFQWDIIRNGDNSYHIIKDSKSYRVEIVKTNYKEKKFAIKINGNRFDIKVEDRHDELLRSLGMDKSNNNKIKEIKAPMPGLVLDILVKEGTEIKKGDPVLILEAMKMENILKSPEDGSIKKIKVRKGKVVEKNDMLVSIA